MPSKAAFCVTRLFSLATRERCMANMKNIHVPRNWQIFTPAAPNSSVLMLLCCINNRVSLVYTVRPSDYGMKARHITFPGGKIGPEETAIEAALRGPEEEIGLFPDRVDVWGHGIPIPGTNQKILITPVVGSIDDIDKNDFKINTKKVDEIFAVPLEILCDSKNQYYSEFKNVSYALPVYAIDDYRIWGMTAYLPHNFLTCLLPSGVYNSDWTKKKINMKENETVYVP